MYWARYSYFAKKKKMQRTKAFLRNAIFQRIAFDLYHGFVYENVKTIMMTEITQPLTVLKITAIKIRGKK